MEWIAASDFIEADVIRWREGVFDRARVGKKARRLGERVIVAEVLQSGDDGWVCLLVRACDIALGDSVGKAVSPLLPETHIKRARKTVLRGDPERLLWSDETAREAVVKTMAAAAPAASKFTRPPPERPPRRKGKALRSRRK